MDICATSKIFILENFCTNIRINGTSAYPQKFVHENFRFLAILEILSPQKYVTIQYYYFKKYYVGW